MDWRTHQKQLQKTRAKKARGRRIVRLILLLLVIGAAVGIIAVAIPTFWDKTGGDGDAVATMVEPPPMPEPIPEAMPEPMPEPEPVQAAEPDPTPEPEPVVEEPPAALQEKQDDEPKDSDRPAPQIVVIPPIDGHGDQSESDFEKKQLAAMIGSHSFEADELFTFKIKDTEGHELFVRTTLDPDIQAWAVSFLPKQKVRAAALVVMDPETGEVLAMAGHNEKGGKGNVALSSSFPAASLFKIVTAAAVVEKEKMDSESKLAYDGGRHTLYKRDVVNKDIKKGSHQVTLKEGFAHSINTVFGKLGAFTLGPKELEAFANKFHFNQPIGFELPVQESRFETDDPDDPYRLAELASGFNRTTQVSPLHGAMLASAIVNSGRLMEPTVVREVFDLNNRIYYRHETVGLGQVVSKRTVDELKDLMRATVREGTGRRRFWDAQKHPVLSKLDIGGKSGTINNNQGHKVDWFVGYAGPKKSKRAIALAAVVVHGPKLGVRSQELVREAIIRYYGPKLLKKKN